MSNNKLAKLLTDTLPSRRSTLFNPWRDRCDDDEPWNGPDAKLTRLAAHLACNPKFITYHKEKSVQRRLRHDSLEGTV